MTGRFITFEGGEGGGKSTQARRLGERLRGLGLEVVQTREPGGTPRAERLREALLGGRAKRFGPFAETLLLASARADHVDQVIRPALRRDAVVICDRFIDSTRAYQGAAAGVDGAAIRALETIATGGAAPDLTIILDVPPQSGLARARTRAGERTPADRFEAEEGGFHDRLRRAFLDIAESEPERCVVIDASEPEERVSALVWDAVSTRIRLELLPQASR